MYCVKCGKAVNELNGDLCSDCAGQPVYGQPVYGQPVYVQPVYGQPVKPPYGDPANKMVGFGGALSATIMGVIGFIFSYIAIVMFMVSRMPYIGGSSTTPVFLALIGLTLSIAALALGISSIKVFSGFKNARPKPVATLVLGIVGVANGAISLFICFLLVLVGLTS